MERSDQLLEVIAAAAVQSVDELHNDVEGRAKGRVHRVTGDLADAIGTEPAKRVSKTVVTGSVGVGKRIRYAFIEELEHPYLRPSYDSEAPSLARRIAAKTQRVIK